MNGRPYPRVRSLHFDSQQRPARAVIVTSQGLVRLQWLEVAGDRIDLIGTGGDIGTQRGMMLIPALWRRHIKPNRSLDCV